MSKREVLNFLFVIYIPPLCVIGLYYLLEFLTTVWRKEAIEFIFLKRIDFVIYTLVISTTITYLLKKGGRNS